MHWTSSPERSRKSTARWLSVKGAGVLAEGQVQMISEITVLAAKQNFNRHMY